MVLDLTSLTYKRLSSRVPDIFNLEREIITLFLPLDEVPAYKRHKTFNEGLDG